VSRALLDDHRKVWLAKPALQRIYGVWFDAILKETPPAVRALEVGAGPGLLRAHARSMRPDLHLVASDIETVPWLDLTADCMRIPVRDHALHAIVGLDVIHHLAQPAAFFAEAARTLAAGGRIAVVEPWVTPFSYPIYRWLHQEGCRLDLDPWDPFRLEGKGRKDAFQGDGAVVSRLVRTTDDARWRSLGFEPPRLTILNAFAYLLSLGFKRGTILPSPLVGPLLALDRGARALAPWVGLRALVVWERAAS